MNPARAREEEGLLERALRAARDTRFLVVAPGARHDAARVFVSAFGDRPAVIVADGHTFAAAGADVRESFQRAGIGGAEPLVFGPDVAAESAFVDALDDALGATDAIPVAVGSGVINDLTKLAAHRRGRPYLAVATAASMDGYTAYGASITHRGSKQTFDCPAPRAVVADLDVMARAPVGMNAAGYADLLAKGVAGADWILADAMGEEPIDPSAWETVQTLLPAWVAAPGAIARGEPEALRRLVVGLLMSGFAMQAARSSRPASGADHQFSHLWDMQHHTHEGAAPSHGFKVGIGTLASLALYEDLLGRDLDRLDLDGAVAAWPPWEQVDARIEALLGSGELAEKAREETRAKHPTREALRAQLVRLRADWPALRERLSRHLAPFRDARALLRQAGCPTEPEQIGISRERLRRSYEQAYYIRRRFTVLDVAMRLGLLESALDALFGPGGAWDRRGESR
ncbi:MAG: sn-glycerol-1-phosphate dehydrogenase [Isosphaeraceae bacterium]|nr:sn-glycerol-1-phosphate dehydrogenase [Isosphaeraceae bacterium]